MMLPLLSVLLFFTLSPNPVTSELALEFGYSVSTVIDFNKYENPSTIFPFALLPRRRSSAGDGSLLLLDSINSAFYSLPIPISQESSVRLFAGKGGVAGFSDGDKMTAMFDKPRSFAIDGGDNVYVADRSNHAIRKISPSGMTTTIAGGYSEKKPGHIDGPAQNASFSNDFDLVYIPTICALLISDRGHRLIRQLKLKPEDCTQKTQAGLGVAPVSAIAVLCLFFGLVLGFVARPFVSTRGIANNRFINKTWKHYQTKLGRLLLITYSGIRSAVANSALSQIMLRLVNLSICYLSVVFRNIRLINQVQYGRKKTHFRENSVCSGPISLLESDVVSDHVMQKPDRFADQLQDLISFDEGMGVLEATKLSERKSETGDGSEGSSCKIDDTLNANLVDFSNQPKNQLQIEGSTVCFPGLVHRRPVKADELSFLLCFQLCKPK